MRSQRQGISRRLTEISIKELKEAGIEFHTDTMYVSNPETKDGFPRISKSTGMIRSVKLPWTPEEWLAVLDKEGEYLGGCCGNISAARDELFTCLRDGGWIDSNSLMQCCMLLREHDGWCPVDLPDPKPYHKDPISRLIWIWEQVKDILHTYEYPSPLDPVELKDAIHVFSRGVTALWMNDIFQDADDKKHTTEPQIRKALLLSRLYPAVKTIYEKLLTLDPGPSDAFVIVMKDTGKPADTRSGWAIYDSPDRCEETIKIWETSFEERSEEEGGRPKEPEEKLLPVRERIEIRKCHVDVKSGLVIGDRV